MSRIQYISALLLVLFISVAATAQERGDGEAAARRQIHDKDVIDGRGRKGGRSRGHHGRSDASLSNIGKNTKGLFRRFRNDNSESVPPLFSRGRTELGIKAGVNFQEMAQSPFSPTYKPGFVGGGYFRRYFRRTGIRMELLASTGSYISQNPAAYYAEHNASMDTVGKSMFKGVYMSVPILFEHRMFRRMYFQLGPQISYLLSSSDKNGLFTKIYGRSDVFRKAEFSMMIGADFQLPHKVRIGARYVKGLTDVNSSVYPKAYFAWAINSLQVHATYNLFQSKPQAPRLIPEKAVKEKKEKKKDKTTKKT